MKFRPSYILIPLVTIIVALLGSEFTTVGMGWYNSEVVKPALEPPRWAFPVVWNTIFVLTTISAIMIWNKETTRKIFWFSFKKTPTPAEWMVMWLFVVNAILNVLWSYLFFAKEMISAALIEMIIMEILLIALIFGAWKISKIATSLLLPYAVWVGIATYLTYNIYILNVV